MLYEVITEVVAVVEHLRYHVADVVGLVRRVGDDIDEAGAGARDVVAACRERGVLDVVLGQVRQQLANALDRGLLVGVV